MSERYFRQAITGTVVALSDEYDVENWSGWTEVQVAPLDAVVVDPSAVTVERIGDKLLVSGVGLTETVILAPDEGPERWQMTADRHAAEAAHAYAIAAHLRPPVDEAQVKAVTDLILADPQIQDTDGAREIARRLVEHGVRVEVAS